MRHRAGLEPDELPGRTRSRRLWCRDGISVLDVRGQYEPFPWTATWLNDRWSIVLPRSGVYRRRYDGVEHIVDANTGFVRRPGEETAMAMPAGVPDTLTIVDVDESAIDTVGALSEVAGPLPMSPAASLGHRLLRSCLSAGVDDLAVEEVVGDVVAAARGDRGQPVYTRASTELTHRRVVLQTCELLQVAPAGMTLVELARHVAVSPFHLTKIFRRVTGTTISQYRARLRVHAVLERISSGDDDLSSIAASTGFADHSHMTRTVVAQLGHTPSDLRRLLGRRR